MSIPLDCLYNYIDSVAKKVHGDTIIYRFYPHGSKNIENLEQLSKPILWAQSIYYPKIYCNDQEILNYDLYQNINANSWRLDYVVSKQIEKSQISLPNYNLRIQPTEIYDNCILLHSELRSNDLEKYKKNYFTPVYYWSHALIALDWYRFAKHVTATKSTNTKSFLIYNRAWSGSREYRLKFADYLIDSNLVDHCQTTCNIIDPEINISYHEHKFKNTNWIPIHTLEDYFLPNLTSSNASANFNIDDYSNTDFEVVLETIFDDSRLHLTEKTLRPIACSQPFLLVGTHGSLEYLRSYGFETFGDVIDENYDSIVDPVQRLKAIVDCMKSIRSWNHSQRIINMKKLQAIADRNHRYFFSENFFNLVTNELKNNLAAGLTEITNSNTGQRFLDLRKSFSQDPELKKIITNTNSLRSRQDIVAYVRQARYYYNCYLKTLNK